MSDINENLNNFDNSDITENSPEAKENEPSDNILNRFSDVENNIYQSIYEDSEVMLDENFVPKKEGRAGKILLIVFTALMLAIAAGLAVYCIVSDIRNVGNLDGIAYEPDNEIRINTSHRPMDHEMFADESGKYTIEGLAQIVRPQVVEIYTYSDKSSDVIVGSGSGIIISSDGYIVTNTHVLDNMEKYVVNTFDGLSCEAKIIGRDAKTDISVIKIEANGLSAAQFGNSDDLIQGEAVVAIGNPAGLTGSITDGIVSGLNRKIRAEATGFEMNCIQTNAAISPGNSGGALVNMYGQVIGITSSKYATTTTEGLGFAITINEAKPIIEELISKGYVSGRVRVGITFYSSYANYTAVQFKEEFGFDMPKELENALWISDISKDCDISNTELKVNDFILSLEGKAISDYAELSEILKGKKGGDIVKAKCARITEDKKTEYFEIEFKLMSDTSGDF